MTIVLASCYEPQNHRGSVYNIALSKKMRYPRLPGDLFVPTWDIVDGHRQGRISDEQYLAVYKTILRTQLPAIKTWLAGLKAEETITLLCYCHESRPFCHRQYVAKVIAMYRPDLEVIVH